MRTRTSLPALLAALLLALALTGCGSDGGAEQSSGSADGASDDAAGEESPAASASLTDDPFCDLLTEDLAAEVTGLPAEQVALSEEASREVGEKYAPYPGAKKVESTFNSCSYGEAGGLYVSVAPTGYSEVNLRDSRERKDEATPKTGGMTCETADAPDFGDPAFVADCESKVEPAMNRVYVESLVEDGSYFFCMSSVPSAGAEGSRLEPTVSACLDVFETLAG